jgi:hypothetical protein
MRNRSYWQTSWKEGLQTGLGSLVLRRTGHESCVSVHQRAVGVGLLALALLAPSALAADPAGGSTDRPPRGSSRSIEVPTVETAPVVDGQLDDASWRTAASSGRFWIALEQRWPSDQTQVLVMADEENLYFGFRVYDAVPARIEALQTRRDVGLGLDDRVTVELDPFMDFTGSSGSTFSVSASGTQDGEIGSGRGQQLAWKGEWRAAAALTDYGWSAEIAIPFSILNYEREEHAFGVNFFRYQNRTRELSQWADTTPQDLPEELGRLVGLRLPATAKAEPWTLLPYVYVGKDVPNRNGEVRDRLANAGIDVRYEPRPNLTGVLSLNPDFSQTEQAVTDINFSYNEKRRSDYRTFFQEGSAYFGGNEEYYFYSNRIPDFDYGAKAFGRFGGSQFGGFVTRSPDDRLDLMAQLDHQFDETHRLGAVLVGTDNQDFGNLLYAVNGSGREASGFNYALDAALTRTDDVFGDGHFAKGEIGWQEDYWSASVTADTYTEGFFPANGLVDRDLLDTSGGVAALGYYRDFGDGPLRNLQGSLYWEQRYTGEDELQKRYGGVSGSVEFRKEVRVSLGYTGGDYRPAAGPPGEWEDFLFEDHYWTADLEFNTQSSRLNYGVSYADGFLGGGDYAYVAGYLTARPSSTTYVSLASERLRSFGTYDQTVLNVGWDITPEHQLSGRYIDAYYGDSVRVAYAWRLRKNADLFVVYDWFEGTDYKLSAKVVMAFPL